MMQVAFFMLHMEVEPVEFFKEMFPALELNNSYLTAQMAEILHTTPALTLRMLE